MTHNFGTRTCRNAGLKLAVAVLVGHGTHASAASSSAGVCFYEHIAYAGASYCVGVGEVNSLPRGWNNLVSSVRIAAGLKLEMFDKTNRGGRSVTLRTDASNFFSQSFNDVMSSYRVSVTSTPAPVPQTFNVAGQVFLASACATEGHV